VIPSGPETIDVGKFSRETWYIILSFLIIYVVWGSTYLFISFAVKQLSPFYLSGVRFLLAATILLGLGIILQRIRVASRKQVLNAIVAGIFFLGFGATGVAWALRYVDTGFVALFISAQPLVVVVMMWVLDRKPPPLLSFVGIAMGMMGIYLLVSQQDLIVKEEQWIGILAILCSMFCWGAGSIFISRSDMPKSPYLNNGIQMISGCILAMIISFFLEPPAVSVWEWTDLTIMAVLYLGIIGSAMAFTAFNYLLTKVSPEKVATSTYVNPIVALLLGWMFNNESISGQSIVAAAIMLLGVYFINFKNPRNRRVV